MKDLAVVMSVYKGDNLFQIIKSIESILYQTYSEFDFFIKIDGPVSLDIKKYLENLKDERIKLFFRDENKGLACSLNELLINIMDNGYSYIARMDADDISKHDRFFKQIEFLNRNINVDIVGSFIDEIDINDRYICTISYPTSHLKMKIKFGIRNPLAHPAVMFRNTFFIKAGIYPLDTDRNEDTMLWLSGFLNNCIFANIPESLLYFRIDENFYYRRSGIKKAFSDFKDRMKIIRLLKLKKIYTFTNVLKLIIFAVKSKMILRFIYKIAR
jgi:Glycosyl transferase family 2.